MQCEQVREQLTYMRELGPAERDAVQRHLAECPVCQAIWEQYEAQDRALATLPGLAPSRDFSVRVLARTTQQTRSQRLGRRLATNALAIALALAVVVTGGTVGASAQALPGQALYPVKRAVEQARMALTVSEVRRAALTQQLQEERREEVRRVLASSGTAQVGFQGEVQGVKEGGIWVVSGIDVQMAPDIADQGPNLVGEVIQLAAEVQDGHVAATEVRVRPTPTGVSAPTVTLPKTNTPVPTPTEGVRSEPTQKPTTTPKLTATPGERDEDRDKEDEEDGEKKTKTPKPTKVKATPTPTRPPGLRLTPIVPTPTRVRPTDTPRGVSPTARPTEGPSGPTVVATLRPIEEPTDRPPTRPPDTEPTTAPTFKPTAKVATPVPTAEPTQRPPVQPTKWRTPGTTPQAEATARSQPTSAPTETDDDIEPTPSRPLLNPTAEPQRTRERPPTDKGKEPRP
jgi:hypothetical protein